LSVTLSESKAIIELSVYTKNWSKRLEQELEKNIKKNKQDHIWYIDDSQVLSNEVLIFVYHEEPNVHRSLEDVFLLFLNVAFPGYKKYKHKTEVPKETK